MSDTTVKRDAFFALQSAAERVHDGLDKGLAEITGKEAAALLAHIDSLVAERDALRAEKETLHRMHLQMCNLAVERYEALKRYGVHAPDCLATLQLWPQSKCTCGLSDVLEGGNDT